jgi:hypothetical protein
VPAPVQLQLASSGRVCRLCVVRLSLDRSLVGWKAWCERAGGWTGGGGGFWCLGLC